MRSVKRILIIIVVTFCFHQAMGQSMEWICRPNKYVDIEYMGHDLFKVKTANGKWGIISDKGREVFNAEYDSITSFVEGRSLLLDKTGRKLLGIIGLDGEIIKSFKEGQIYTTSYPYYKEGLLGFKDSNGLCGYLNNSGNVSIQPKFYLAAPFQDGIATVQYTEGKGYFGLINKSGGSAIITDTEYKFLSSMVDGLLMAVTSTRIGDLLRVMRLDGSQLKGVAKLESKMFIDLSDDFTYLISQNGHHYFIDDQWRISGANYDYKLPYELKASQPFVIESSELLSKQDSKDGVQITYLGKPILEHDFNHVETYEKKYAIVSAKDKSVGVLKLNPSAGIEIIAPTYIVDFYHNPFPSERSANLEEMDLKQYVSSQVDIKDVNPLQLKCYVNEEGFLRYAPLKKHGEIWYLYIPYFQADVSFGNVITKNIDIAITYDGLEWMHRMITLSSKHETGYNVRISGSSTTNKTGKGKIQIIVEAINGVPATSARITIAGVASQYMKESRKVIEIEVDVPEGERKTFSYSVEISEEGCPTVKTSLSKVIENPVKNDNSGEKKKVKLI